MTENVKTNKIPHEERFHLILQTMGEVLQQAQFAAVNIAIAANRICKDYGKDSEIGRSLENLASQVSDATKKIETISNIAIEGINTFDYRSFTQKNEIDPQTLKKLEESFSIIMGSSKKVIDLLKQLKPVA
ncbi:MAG: hypothetical protein GY855_11650 [candidate division Zixibacteria bacterium]|nr:hypothetical protein [candidate division Zixibacteria bacterium]